MTILQLQIRMYFLDVIWKQLHYDGSFLLRIALVQILSGT